jgi:hypothetical protein
MTSNDDGQIRGAEKFPLESRSLIRKTGVDIEVTAIGV